MLLNVPICYLQTLKVNYLTCRNCYPRGMSSFAVVDQSIARTITYSSAWQMMRHKRWWWRNWRSWREETGGKASDVLTWYRARWKAEWVLNVGSQNVSSVWRCEKRECRLAPTSSTWHLQTDTWFHTKTAMTNFCFQQLHEFECQGYVSSHYCKLYRKLEIYA